MRSGRSWSGGRIIPTSRAVFPPFSRGNRFSKATLNHGDSKIRLSSSCHSVHSLKHLKQTAMSVTTSTNTVSQSVLHLLADYEVHHSEELVEPGVIEEPNPRPEPHVENPEWWPTDHHRIPDHRPINRNLDRDLRPAGSFFVETCFILTMLGGCAINAVSARIAAYSWQPDDPC